MLISKRFLEWFYDHLFANIVIEVVIIEPR